MYPTPVFTDLHQRAEGANQKCCSIKETKKMLRRGHRYERARKRFISENSSRYRLVHFPFAFRATRACASLCSNSARLSSSGRSKKFSLTYNPRFSSGSSLSMLQSLNTHLVNANCSVPWSMSSVHFTNSQRSKRVNVILPRKSN